MSKPPPFRLWASEVGALPKVLTAPLRGPVKVTPFGEGRPVLVIPGMLSGDATTALLRTSLSSAGFDTYGWGGGLNTTVNAESVERVEKRLADIAARTGQGVILIGWSLGGLYARLLAHRRPALVAMVMTLGSPFSGDRRANNAWRVYQWLNDHRVDATPFKENVGAKPPVRTIAMWSGVDGIIAPESARGLPEQSDRQVELPYRHLELGSSRRAIAEILSVLRDEVSGAD